jgi:adenine deaminase
MAAGSFTDDLARRLSVARGDEPADMVLKGGRVLSVFTRELLHADVAVSGEHVAGVGSGYEGRDVFDASGLTIVPGFIDGHMHIESTKLMPAEFARAVLPHGTTTVVIDPHEIANVFGLDGVRALLATADGVPLDVFVMVSSCVPASEFESSGATVTAEEIAAFLAEEPRALGVAEMMNFPSVAAGDADSLAKVAAAGMAGDRHIDGHAPGLTGKPLNAYLAAGVRSDHECTTYEEALEKRRLGMWIMIREGSAARNLEALLPLVLEHGSENCMLCTDDREPDDLLEDGHIDAVVRKAVALGCPPEQAVTMGTLNAARYHRLHEHGAVAPGYLADLVALPDLREFRPAAVWKRGRLVAREGRVIDVPHLDAPDWMRGSVRVPPLSADHFRMPASGGRVRVIGVEAGEIVTKSLSDEPGRRDGQAAADPARDLAKIAVVERHRGTGRLGVGFVRGFGLQRGALASTHAHDAHNVVVVGVDDDDMAAAVNRLASIGGGQVVVAGGQVVAEVPCPIGGLLSDQPAEAVAAAVRRMHDAVRGLGATLPSPFMAMSFMALSVIPELKITDRGLVDTVRFELVPLEI